MHSTCVSELLSHSTFEEQKLLPKPCEPCSQVHEDSPGVKRSFPCLNSSKDSSKLASLVLRKSKSILLFTALQENHHQDSHINDLIWECWTGTCSHHVKIKNCLLISIIAQKSVEALLEKGPGVATRK